jgi:hypothetical protein
MRVTTGLPAAKLGTVPAFVAGMQAKTEDHAHDEHGHGTRHLGRRRRQERRAVAVLVVLLLIAVSLAVSYATLRSQSSALLIQQNADLGAAARQAAFTGMTIGLKQMQTGDWTGVDSVVSGSLNDATSYQAAYFAGDASLAPGDPEYAELPYRVTILATGQAVDAGDLARVATHEIRAVVRLVPRDLGPQPVDWEGMQQYTVYQSKNDAFEIDIPCRIEGPVRAQGTLRAAAHYPNDYDAWKRYLTDLNAMRVNLQQDYRPLTGPISLPRSAQTVLQLSGLENRLGVTLNDVPTQETAADFSQPALPSSYRLYDGGPLYTIPRVLANPLENVTLEADPSSNPLGLFYRETNLSIRDNVTIRGSLICRDDVDVEGINVRFEPVEMPSLHEPGAAEAEVLQQRPLRLPAVSCRNFNVKSTGGGSLTGLVAAFNEFKVEKSPATVAFQVTGRIIARRFFVKERQPWETEKWSDHYIAFMIQLVYTNGGVTPVPCFPIWLAKMGLDPKPSIRIVPDPTPVDYRWKMSYDTILLPHAGDASPQDPNNPGLRWDLLEWTDRP